MLKKLGKKIWVLVFLCLLLGCQKKSQVLVMPTAASSGNLYPLGASIAGMYNKKLPDIQVSNQASNGGYDNLHLMERKEANLSFGVSNIVYDAYYGKDIFKNHGNKDLRVIAGLYYNPNQIVVRADKGINSLKDLEGKVFAPGVHGSTTEKETQIHLDLIGVDQEKIRFQYLGFSEAGEEIRNNQLDGAWIMAGTPAAAVTELMTTGKVKILNLDDGYLKVLKDHYPYYVDYCIEKGTYPGQEEDVMTSSVKMLYYTDTSLDEDTVYQLTKTFWENIDDLAESNSALKGLKPEDALKDISGLPVHSGAMRYYKEIQEDKN